MKADKTRLARFEERKEEGDELMENPAGLRVEKQDDGTRSLDSPSKKSHPDSFGPTEPLFQVIPPARWKKRITEDGAHAID